jgi:hypothetical protein
MQRSRDGCEDMKTGGAKSQGEAASGTRVGGVEVHIDELVLRGFEVADRFPIRDELERELTRLLAERGALSHLSGPMEMEIERMNGGSFKVAPDGRVEGVGAEVAGAVHGALAAARKVSSSQKMLRADTVRSRGRT